MADLQIQPLIDSSQEWIQAVLNDFDTFLVDHADCERKASGMAMNLVAKYPDRDFIIPGLIRTGIEELEHFRLVHKIMVERGIRLPHKMTKDLYVGELLQQIRGGRDEGFMDRMILGAIVENRGFERFKLIAENISDKKLADFYDMIYQSEHKHGEMFLEMAIHYLPEESVLSRYNEMVDIEAGIIQNLKIRPALH